MTRCAGRWHGVPGGERHSAEVPSSGEYIMATTQRPEADTASSAVSTTITSRLTSSLTHFRGRLCLSEDRLPQAWAGRLRVRPLQLHLAGRAREPAAALVLCARGAPRHAATAGASSTPKGSSSTRELEQSLWRLTGDARAEDKEETGSSLNRLY